jgi:hypothetical protein
VDASDIRLVLAGSYLLLLLWRSRVEGHIPEYWWIVIIVYFVSMQLTRWGETFVQRWRLRRTVRSFSMLDPSAKEAALKRLWSSSARYQLTELIRDEGEPEIGEAIERYPFTRSAKVLGIIAFWMGTALASALFAALVLVPQPLSSALGWVVWGVAAAIAIIAGVLRRRMHFLESILEVSRFGLAEVDADGTRRTIGWTAPLILRYRKWPQRFELSISGRRDMIRLDFDRAGIDRAFRLTLEYGGFPEIRPKGDAA